MRLSNVIYGLMITVLIFTSVPLQAHHSFAAEYDGTKPIKLTGTVTKFDMVNPHSWIYIDVKDDSGKIVNWKFETASPSNLYRRGFKKDTIKSGMQVTLEGYLAKDGSATANGQKLYMPDGTVIVLGTEVNPG
ncbi:MAG: hypothetical protein DMG14_11570 [Acidobacteria bacterium]|nr:MAG: hypothetical protein DMG14_11570 [Acidobacteriota bacterium]